MTLPTHSQVEVGIRTETFKVMNVTFTLHSEVTTDPELSSNSPKVTSLRESELKAESEVLQLLDLLLRNTCTLSPGSLTARLLNSDMPLNPGTRTDVFEGEMESGLEPGTSWKIL